MSTPRAVNNPFLDPPPTEIHLSQAPLVRVIAQVKFPEALNVERADVVSDFQTAIAQSYGVLKRESGIRVASDIVGGSQALTHWRFSDDPLKWKWRVTLASGFVALETAKYTTRAEFFERLEMVLEAVHVHIKPTLCTRTGVRYVNRIAGQDVIEARTLVRAEMLGLLSTVAAERASHVLTQAAFEIDGKKLQVTCGLLPPNGTPDPNVIDPLAEPSFVLDIDVSDESPSSFAPETIAARAKSFAERNYTFFRWAVSDQFLLRFGGKL